MSKVGEMVKRQAGVEYVELGKVCSICTGKTPDIITDEGIYSYMNGGSSCSGYTDGNNCDGKAVVTPSRGSIGSVNFCDGPFWLGPLCYCIRSVDEGRLLTKFVFYALNNI